MKHDTALPARRAILAAVPIVGVNTVAFCGQLGYIHDHLPWPPAGQVLVAAVLESIAVYFAWQAHLALTGDDSALRLRLAAYGTALLIAAMNYSHYAGPHGQPTFAAVAFAFCSAISPWLWSVHSRRESRDTLKAAGLIEPHAVRLGATRWAWHPVRCTRVMSRATWTGTTDPAAAIALLTPPGELPPAAGDALLSHLRQLPGLPSQRALADGYLGGDRRKAARVLEQLRAGMNGHGNGSTP